MHNNISITILVPVYGVEKYIVECARSLFAQTYKDLKYVFCDDCTPDRSLEILKTVIDFFPNRKDDILVIRNSKNIGLGGSRAELIKHINTEYFMIVDSDDVLPLDAVKLLAAKMDSCQADVIEGSYALCSSKGIDAICKPLVCRDEYFRKLVYTKLSNSTNLWGKLYKTSILKKTGPLFFQGIDMAEDLCASTIICSITSRATINEIVYHYRVDNNSNFKKLSVETNFISYLNANRKIFEYFKSTDNVSLPIELGLLHCYRTGHCQNIDASIITEKLHYIPETTITKLLEHLLKSNNSICYHIGLVLLVMLRRIVLLA